MTVAELMIALARFPGNLHVVYAAGSCDDPTDVGTPHMRLTDDDRLIWVDGCAGDGSVAVVVL